MRHLLSTAALALALHGAPAAAQPAESFENGGGKVCHGSGGIAPLRAA